MPARDARKQDRERAAVVEKRQMLDGRAANAFDRILAPREHRVGALAIAEVAGDADGGLARQRIGVQSSSALTRAHISGCPSELSAPIAACRTVASACASSGSSGSNACEVADPRERGRGRPPRSRARRRRSGASGATAASIAEAPERDDRREPRVVVVGAQLLDEQIHHAGILADDRLDDVGANRGLTEQAGQRLFDGAAAQPAEHGDQGAAGRRRAPAPPRRAPAARRPAAAPPGTRRST